MQAELARLDPRALENLPKELKDQLPRGLPLGGGGPLPKLPSLPGLPGGMRLPGLPGKKK
jgi:signal recognition particle subunit SRP54